MNDEQNPNEPRIGLYRHAESGTFVGALDPNQAAAFERVGYKLYLEGREAAMSSQEELDALTPGPEQRDTVETGPKKGAK